MKKQNFVSVCCLTLALLMVFLSAGCGADGTDRTDSTTTASPAGAPSKTPSAPASTPTEATPPASSEPASSSATVPVSTAASVPTSAPATEDLDDPEELISELTPEELVQVKIVYPKDQYSDDSAVVAAILQLQATFASYRYNLDIPIVGDVPVDGDPTTAESKCEILIGNTNRAASASEMTDLRPKDYGYCIVRNKIVIKGGSDEALLDAINAFHEDIVKKRNATSKPFYSEFDDLYKDDAYLGVGLSLNGTHISQFSIVTPAKSNLYEDELAERLSDYLLLITGYRIPCYKDTAEPGEHEILIGVTNRPFSFLTTSGAAIEADSKYVVLVGSNAYDFGIAQQAFKEKIESAIFKSGALMLPAQTKATRSNQVSMMSYNVYGFDVYKTRCENICHLVTKYLPDIVGFQEPGMNMMAYLRMDAYYGYFYGNPRHTDENGVVRPEGSGENSVSPILYAKDRFTFISGDTKWMTGTPDSFSKLEESDFYRIYTYALLHDNFTGEEFIVVNHHLDFDDAVQVKTMKYVFKFFEENFKDIPIVMMGDYNATATSPVIKDLMIDAAGFDSLYTLSGSTGQAASIDWIFAMRCCVTGISYTVCDEKYADDTSSKYDGKMPSDHAAVYAVMRFSSSEEHEHDWSEIASEVGWVKEPTVPAH